MSPEKGARFHLIWQCLTVAPLAFASARRVSPWSVGRWLLVGSIQFSN